MLARRDVLRPVYRAKSVGPCSCSSKALLFCVKYSDMVDVDVMMKCVLCSYTITVSLLQCR